MKVRAGGARCLNLEPLVRPRLFSPQSMARKPYDYALDLLSARAYTTKNLRRKLVQKEFSPDDVAAVIARLAESGLLDDAKYAREFARQKLTSGGSSTRRVQQQLAVKGIPADDARAAIETVMEEESVDIGQSINAATRKKLASMGELPADVKRRRLIAFLARRGFEFADIKRAIDRVS